MISFFFSGYSTFIGTILLSLDHQDKAVTAFRKYVDCLLDLLLPDNSIVDRYEKEEILFLGPDEGTANVMDWASQHAKERGYRFWKAFTTGKSRDRGGIPHDLYGMTTRSIHQVSIHLYLSIFQYLITYYCCYLYHV